MVDTNTIAPIQHSVQSLGQLGPKMQALNPKQRAFVIAMLETGQENYTLCAKMAGYGVGGGMDGLRVTAYRLAHDERIQSAILEQAGRRMKAGAIMATSTLLTIAQNPVHKDQLKAALEILNRTGLHAITESKTTVEHTINDKAMIARVVELARQQGLDPRKLLGGYGVTLDAEFEEIDRAAVEKQQTAAVHAIAFQSEEGGDAEAEHSDEGLEDLL